MDYIVKLSLCLPHWEINGHKVDNCTTEEMGKKDIVRPCRLFARELKFHKMNNDSKYANEDLPGVVRKTKAPVEILIKVITNLEPGVVFIRHCKCDYTYLILC